MNNLASIVLRVIIIVFAVIALGTSGGLYNGVNTAYSRTNFNLFATSWTIAISGFVNIALEFFTSSIGSWFVAGTDILSTIFLFAGACSYADWGGVPNCSADYAKEIWGGSGACRQYQTATAFLFLAFGVGLGLSVLSVMGVLQGGTIGLPRARRSAPRAGVPTMSQV